MAVLARFSHGLDTPVHQPESGDRDMTQHVRAAQTLSGLTSLLWILCVHPDGPCHAYILGLCLEPLFG
jgi:hypothetical protein